MEVPTLGGLKPGLKIIFINFYLRQLSSKSSKEVSKVPASVISADVRKVM